MNVDVRELLAEGERALRGNDLVAARDHFVAAGETAQGYALWRSAARCFRRALEIDLVDRPVVEKLAKMAKNLPHGRDWIDYVARLDRTTWKHFGCRGAQVVIGDDGTIATCPEIGPVLEIMMSSSDLVEVRPVRELGEMPRAMGFVILRRAMSIGGMSLRVVFAGTGEVRIDEHGDWT